MSAARPIESLPDGYWSPFSWRYGSDEMRSLWAERRKRLLWRSLWVALAEAQSDAGLVTAAQLAELRAHQDQVDLPRALTIESEIHHDLMAELRTFAEQCPTAGGVLHMGATSMDIEDNVDALRVRESLDLVVRRLGELLRRWCDQVERWADTPTMAFTHLQPAEPTTVGYRIAQYAQDAWTDWQWLTQLRSELRAKGLRGAVGTAASYAELLSGSSMTCSDLERVVLDRFELEGALVCSQTYPRKQDYRVLSALASLGQTLYKFAFDLRLLQSPPIGEWAEPFGARQVGSSAMPFKRNPIHAENVDSLGRLLAALPRVAWDNAAHCLLERTLDDSANRRAVLPEAFLIADEMLSRSVRIVCGMQIDETAGARLLRDYGVFAATERLLMVAAKRGADRQRVHETIRGHCLVAWAALRAGEPNPLAARLRDEPALRPWLEPSEVVRFLDASGYIGDAPGRARSLVRRIREDLEGSTS